MLTEEIKTDLVAHKPRLLAMLAVVDDRAGRDGSPVAEPSRPAGLAGGRKPVARPVPRSSPAPTRRAG